MVVLSLRLSLREVEIRHVRRCHGGELGGDVDFGGFETSEGIFDGKDGVNGGPGMGGEGTKLVTFSEDVKTGKKVDAEGYYDAAPGRGVAGCYTKYYPVDVDPAPELGIWLVFYFSIISWSGKGRFTVAGPYILPLSRVVMKR